MKSRILIVDDQQEILDSLGAILSDEGYETISARDGQEAIHIVQSDSPDIVFLDIWIPGIDGMQTLKAIKRISPNCSVIMMSGHGTIETAVKAIKLGATDYLEKPLNLEDVLHLVQKAASLRSSTEIVEQDSSIQSLFIGCSPKASALRVAVEKTAASDGSVWIVGDKGTGKEFLARMIHQLERKEKNALVKIKCQDLTEESFTEILVGKNRNADKKGKLFQAAGGTLLLIRLDRLEKGLHQKILSLFKEYSGRMPAFRIISTSVAEPETLLHQQVINREAVDFLAERIIRLPGLNERAEDIPLYANYFLKEASEEFDRDIKAIDDAAMEKLVQYSWPGNVKELKILIEHVVMTAPGHRVTLNDLLIPSGINIPAGDDGSGGSDDVPTDRPIIVDLKGEASEPVPRTSPLHNQKTLRGRVVVYGQGLHSGNKTGLTISPLPPNSGILFGHITSTGTVAALLNNVDSTGYSTCLRTSNLTARTIEHLMAVFHVYGLTNVLVKISGEVPIMDGSAIEFCRLVESEEIVVQEELIEEIRIHEPMELEMTPGSEKSMRVEPSDGFEVEYFLDYPPPIGKMHMHYRCEGPEDFKKEIASARTFGFVRDVRMMDEMGLAGGGRLSNLVLLDEEKVVNPPLRFPDEFVRHKILDIVGDFYLLGRPFKGRIIARQTGHTENIAMLRLINRKMKII